MRFPEFLGIGVPKAASTWLYHHLRMHPDIWMPPVKELHFFDSEDPKWNGDFGSPLWRKEFRTLFVRRLLRRKGLTMDPHLTARWRDDFGRASTKPWSYRVRCEINTIRWHWKFLFSRRNPAWYAALFGAGRGKIKGEITPSYATIPPAAIQRVRELLPQARIVLVLRNPIFRAWSHARMMFHAVEGRSLESVSEDDYKAFFTSQEMITTGDYPSILKNWSQHFTGEQMFIGFYEEIGEAASKFLARVFRFLGVAPLADPGGGLASRRVLPSPEVRMGRKTAQFLAEMYYDQIKALRGTLGGHTKFWLEDAEKILLRKE